MITENILLPDNWIAYYNAEIGLPVLKQKNNKDMSKVAIYRCKHMFQKLEPRKVWIENKRRVTKIFLRKCSHMKLRLLQKSKWV